MSGAAIEVRLVEPETLADVMEWADAAGRVGIENGAVVTISAVGPSITVTAGVDSIRGER